MTIEVQPNTPLADALTATILPKLREVGWGSGDPDDTSLAEYIVLMLVNGRSQQEIAVEISTELLDGDTDDPVARNFSQWLFTELEAQNARINGVPAAPVPSADTADYDPNAMMDAPRDGMDLSEDATQPAVPTGPRSMRGNVNGMNNMRGRDRRMNNMKMGDNALHRTRGNDRINSHNRGPNGMNNMRNNNMGRGGRNNINPRNIQQGLQAMNNMANGMPNMPNGMPNWNPMGGPMPGPTGQPSQMDLFALLEQQNRMMAQLSQQMMSQSGRGGRGSRGSHFNNKRGDHNNNWQERNKQQTGENGEAMQTEGGQGGEDVDMAGNKPTISDPESHMCRFNLSCRNKDCKFAHQSPAAPPGTTVDLTDTCSFGAACKNWKCAGRHPSPAARLAHQSEQDCKFFPNCTNSHCPFRHPKTPLCTNGANCSTPDCPFTHVKTKCKFNPCLNPKCAFTHDEGQQQAKGPTQGEDHPSERKFAVEEAVEEVKPEDADIY